MIQENLYKNVPIWKKPGITNFQGKDVRIMLTMDLALLGTFIYKKRDGTYHKRPFMVPAIKGLVGILL